MIIDTEKIKNNDELLEKIRLRIEDELINRRNNRISVLYNNGLVCKESDGSNSDIIRMGHIEAFLLALRVIQENNV